MSDDDPRVLAGRFADALEHLQSAWGIQYVPGSGMEGMPTPAARPPTAPANAKATSPRSGAPRPSQASPAISAEAAAALRSQASSWSPATKLEYLRHKNVGDCRRCPLARTRSSIVFGVGSPTASVMFVGEAPGADEDRQGEPFVGRAGQRLDAWLADLGVARADVYIANVLKCRPPNNRDPKPEEVSKCSPFLKAQIRAIGPKVIVGLGRHAGMLLSRREDLSLRAMRTARLTYDASGPKDAPGSGRIPLIVTYHPAYVLRQEGQGDAAKATDLVMTDLRRALAMATAGSA